MTQPALSRSLKRLEGHLNANLFTRHASGMTLTPFGSVLRRHAELVEFESNRVVEEIKLMSGEGAGSVRVGFVPSVIGGLFQSALPQIYRAAPKIRIRLIEGSGDRMIEAVARGEVDFAVVGRLHMDPALDVLVTPILKEEVCVAAGARHPIFAKKRKCTLEQLRDYEWALPENGNAIWYGFLELFRSAGLEPPMPAVSTNSVHALKSIVGQHGHLTMMTRVVFTLEERYGLILPVPGTSWMRELAVVRRARSNLMPAARLLLRELHKQAANEMVST